MSERISRLWHRALKAAGSLFKKGAFHIVAGSFLTKFVSFFGSIFVVRLLTKPEYGILGYYENLASYLIIFAGCGMASGMTRYLVLADADKKSDCVWYAAKRGSIWNIFLVAIGVLIMLFYPHPEAFAQDKMIGVILALCIPFVYYIHAGQCALRALYDNKGYALVAFLSTVLLIGARVVGAKVGGLYMTARGRLLAEILAAALCVGATVRQLKLQGNEHSRIDAPFKKEFNRYSMQIMFTDGLWAVFMLNDLYILGRFIGSEAIVADYKVAYVSPANLSILTSAIGIFVCPYFTKHENAKEYQWVKSRFLLVLKTTMLLIGAASIACCLLAKPLIRFLYGEQYLSAVPIMRILLIASFMNNGIRVTVANILSAIGKQGINLIVAGIGIAVQVGLDILLLSVWGAQGVAVSSSVVYLLMGSFLSVYFIKFLNRSIKEGIT